MCLLSFEMPAPSRLALWLTMSGVLSVPGGGDVNTQAGPEWLTLWSIKEVTYWDVSWLLHHLVGFSLPDPPSRHMGPARPSSHPPWAAKFRLAPWKQLDEG